MRSHHVERDGDVVAVRVLIVDDHGPFRLWAGKVLRAGGMDVVGEAETGAGAVELAVELRPDVVLLDVRLPDLDGFAVCRRLDEAGIAVVLCSSRDYGERAAGTPALGFLPKERLSAGELRRLLG